jgi:hypothetical protein
MLGKSNGFAVETVEGEGECGHPAHGRCVGCAGRDSGEDERHGISTGR